MGAAKNRGTFEERKSIAIEHAIKERKKRKQTRAEQERNMSHKEKLVRARARCLFSVFAGLPSGLLEISMKSNQPMHLTGNKDAGK